LQLFYWGCEAEVVVSARQSPSALWGNVRQWLEKTSRKVGWTSRATSIARSNSMDFFLWTHVKEHIYAVPTNNCDNGRCFEHRLQPRGAHGLIIW
jgi:hypothetical protein